MGCFLTVYIHINLQECPSFQGSFIQVLLARQSISLVHVRTVEGWQMEQKALIVHTVSDRPLHDYRNQVDYVSDGLVAI